MSFNPREYEAGHGRLYRESVVGDVERGSSVWFELCVWKDDDVLFDGIIMWPADSTSFIEAWAEVE